MSSSVSGLSPKAQYVLERCLSVSKSECIQLATISKMTEISRKRLGPILEEIIKKKRAVELQEYKGNGGLLYKLRVL